MTQKLPSYVGTQSTGNRDPNKSLHAHVHSSKRPGNPPTDERAANGWDPAMRGSEVMIRAPMRVNPENIPPRSRIQKAACCMALYMNRP